MTGLFIYLIKKMIQYAHLNGQLVAADAGSIKLNDLAILRGYGVFDFFLFYDGHPVFFDDYLDRYLHSAHLLHLNVPFDKEQLRAFVYQLIEANQQTNGAIRMIATGGYAPDGYAPVKPNIIMLQHPHPVYPETYYTDGVKLLSYRYEREIPRAKTINYLMGISALPALRAANAIEVLYHDGQFIRETVRANFYILTPGGKLVTPADKILLGNTRKAVLRIARQFLPVEEREVAFEELKTAQEAFLSSSTRGIMPVVGVDDMVFGAGEPGPVTQKLMAGFEDVRQKYIAEQKDLVTRQS